jgi:DNA polymerase alpha subunit A
VFDIHQTNTPPYPVDDGGEGYVDNGMDDWGQERELYTDEEDEDEAKMTTKEKKRKREEDKERKEQQDGALHKYFNKTVAAAPVKTKVWTSLNDFPGLELRRGSW